jgi:hypothetical protein
MNILVYGWIKEVLIVFLPVSAVLIGMKMYKKSKLPEINQVSSSPVKRGQKNLFIAVILIILQFGIFYFEIFSNIKLSQSITDSYFLIIGFLSVIFSIISLIKKETTFGVLLIIFEIFVGSIFMMGHAV